MGGPADSDSRWDDLVARHQRASALYRRGWIEGLCRTARFVLTTAPSCTPLGYGIVLCQVSSWITAGLCLLGIRLDLRARFATEAVTGSASW